MTVIDVFQLELDKRGVVTSEVDPVTGGIELSSGGKRIDTPSESGYRRVAPSLAKWLAAKNRGADFPARHAWFGDSNVAGLGSVSGGGGLLSAAQTGMAAIFADLDSANKSSFFGDQNVPGGGGTLAAYDNRLALGSGWGSDPSGASTFGGSFITAAGGSSGRLKFTPEIPCNKLTVYWIQTSGLNTALTVYIDGVLVDTINQSGSDSMKSKTYDVLTGSHYIEFGCGATGKAYIAGCIAWVADGKTLNLQGGWCGGMANDLMQVGAPWATLNSAKYIAPDFTTIYCTINDINNSVSTQTYRAAMENIVSGLSTSSNGCLVYGFPSDVSNQIGGLGDAYANQLASLSSDYGWGFYDGRRSFGGSSASAAAKGLKFDTNHPNSAGHAKFASEYFDWLKNCGF